MHNSITKAYKVVRVIDGKYYSAFAMGISQVEYKVGEPTYPLTDFSRLFVFKTMRDVHDWVIYWNDELALWEVEVSGVESNPSEFFVSPIRAHIDDFIKDRSRLPGNSIAPHGTLAVKVVNLISPIDLGENYN